MENNTSLAEGEALLLLVRRSQMSGREIAEALDVAPETLSRIYKRQKLTKKIKRKAAAFFNVPEDYFSQHQLPDQAASEPPTKYTPRSDVLARLEKENDQLKRELEQMRLRLVEQQLISEALADQLKQATDTA